MKKRRAFMARPLLVASSSRAFLHVKIRQASCPTLSEAIDRYANEVSSAKKGRAAEASLSKVWKATVLATRRVDRISNKDLNTICESWKSRYAPATIVRRLAFLSHVYTTLRKRWGHTTLANPVQLVNRPTVNNARERRLFTDIKLRGISEEECPSEELDWIIRCTRSKELPTILLIARETGMRRSEVAYVEREDISVTHAVIKLHDTKNGEAREVPLTPLAIAVLRRWLVGRPSRGRIFSMEPGSITRAFIRARKRARIEYEKVCDRHNRLPHPDYFLNLHFHDLRHEGTSRMGDILNLHELSRANGNRDMRTLRRYYHPKGTDMAKKLANSRMGKQQIADLRRGWVPPGIAREPRSYLPAANRRRNLSVPIALGSIPVITEEIGLIAW